MDAFYASLSALTDVTNILVLVIGTVIGTLIGAIPGLSATMAVAIALPFTFTMDPVAGILMLLGIYKGGIYGGSITAILINTPGTPAGAATVLDGYPLAGQNRARAALQMSLYASVIADFISNLSLILFAGVLANLARKFGPPEYFWLIVFSLTIVASVSGDQLLKGLVSAAGGLLVSTIGIDLLSGQHRMTFGVPELYGGVALVPFVIGLFAIPEVIRFYATRRGEVAAPPAAGESLTLKEFLPRLPTIIRGSLIGVVVGALPGTGSTPAAFVSYGLNRRISRFGGNYGKGELDGLAAAEAANNGTAGSSLIPLLTLGIPGDTVTAVLVGAFLIHGLTPGPLLFQENLPFLYTLFVSIMLTSVVLLAFGLVLIRSVGWVVAVPQAILVPIVLALCIVGAFAVNNSVFDVGVMAATGVVGYLMICARIPLAPCIIGLVLGQLLEDNFRRSMLIGRGNPEIFFQSTLSFVLITLAVLSIFFALRRPGKRAETVDTANDKTLQQERP